MAEFDAPAARAIVEAWFTAYLSLFIAEGNGRLRGRSQTKREAQRKKDRAPHVAEFRRLTEQLAGIAAQLKIDSRELFDLVGNIDGATAATKDAARSLAHYIRGALQQRRKWK